MSIVTLSLTKAHCKIDGNADDELVQFYIDAAEQWLANYIGVTSLAEFDPVPADLRKAVMDLVAFYYEVRGVAGFGVSMHMAPFGVTSIAESYRVSRFGVTVNAPQAVEDDF